MTPLTLTRFTPGNSVQRLFVKKFQYSNILHHLNSTCMIALSNISFIRHSRTIVCG